MNEKAINTILKDSNRVLVSQGDPKGIGLEVFFKSFILLSNEDALRFILFAGKSSCKETLTSIHIPFEISNDHIKIIDRKLSVVWCDNTTLHAFESALDQLNPGDVIFTLPATKDSFPKGSPGHTTYLRNRFQSDLTMFFNSPESNIMLLTDHIPLSKVEESITPQVVINHSLNSLTGITTFFGQSIKRVLFAGINPHAGENGLLGKDADIFKLALTALKLKKPNIEFIGPISGDIISTLAQRDDLIVYASHDQGLAPFKALNHFIGANITLGLDFLRLSVDHGTALDMFGKNQANYMGCLYCLELSLKALGKYEKNA